VQNVFGICCTIVPHPVYQTPLVVPLLEAPGVDTSGVDASGADVSDGAA
jgi:hypothetical protein